MTTQVATDPTTFADESTPSTLGIPLLAKRARTARAVSPETLLENASYLLHYAVEAGLAVDPEISQRVITARLQGASAWAQPDAGLLASAIAKLAGLVHPVTAESLRACREQAHQTIRSYRRMACALAAIILPLSMITFIYTGLSNAVTADLATANTLTVNLHAQLTTSDAQSATVAAQNSLPDLQQLAATIRTIRARTAQLAWFAPVRLQMRAGEAIHAGEGMTANRFELDPKLSNTVVDLRKNLDALTGGYQIVREDAKAAQDSASLLYGAIGACILPVLYALLGACAYLLRAFSDQVANQTFRPTYATSARFVIAAIGGAVVGLFNNFSLGQGASLSPLAFAFLVGYAADIFFSFLEGSLQNFSKPKA